MIVSLSMSSSPSTTTNGGGGGGGGDDECFSVDVFFSFVSRASSLNFLSTSFKLRNRFVFPRFSSAQNK